MSRADEASLKGLKALVTRPAGQSASLVQAIQALGGSAHSFPLIEIQPVRPCPDELSDVGKYDLIIFISRNAVDCAWSCLSVPLPESVKLAVVGQATAAALASHGRQPDIVPDRQFDSEGLLAMPELDSVAGQNILIIRGRGGREKLAESLRERGAQVDYAEVYQRFATEQVLTFNDDEIDVIIITSREALDHLHKIAQQMGKSWLLEKPMVVIHERVARRAAELGFTLKPVVAEQSSETALVAALRSVQYESR